MNVLGVAATVDDYDDQEVGDDDANEESENDGPLDHASNRHRRAHGSITRVGTARVI